MYSPIFSESFPINKAYTNKAIVLSFFLYLNRRRDGETTVMERGERDREALQLKARVTWRHDLSVTARLQSKPSFD